LVASVLTSVLLELPVSRRVRAGVENSSVSMFVQPIAGWLFRSMLPREPSRLAAATRARTLGVDA
jgi:hypothetical protein